MESDKSKSRPVPGLLAWLRLMRLPTVFTSLTNILCGYMVSSPQRNLPGMLQETELWLLLLASAGLYLGGMVLNDVFDAPLDAQERSDRPIPSGQINRSAAGVFGAMLLTLGLISAWFSGHSSIIIAAVLATTVLLYDGLLKNTMFAPVGMGTCRFLNVMLGASTCGPWKEIWSEPGLLIAVAMGVYVFGVTLFAQNEAGKSSRGLLVTGLIIALAGLCVNACHAWRFTQASSAAQGALIALALIAANVSRRSVRAIAANRAILLQKSVGFMLLNIIFIDATMTFCVTGSGRLAALVVVLVIPATLMKRVIPMS